MKKNALSTMGIYLILFIGALFIIVPFFWMVSTSLKSSQEIISLPIKWIPEKPLFENYKIALSYAPFDKYFINSIVVTISITIGELITTIMASYAFAKIKFKGRDIIFALLVGTMMVPSEILIIPNFITITKLGWVDTYQALIIPWCASVFSIFLLRQYLLGVPDELYYAAKVDGCSEFKYLWTVVVPCVKPAIITIALLKIINSWNSFMWPLIVTNSEEMRTLPVALSRFSSEAGTHYNYLMAASTMIILPLIIIYIIMQKHLIQGISKSGIKG